MPVLSASGEISLLSAAAKEFKPGGGFSESTTQGQNEVRQIHRFFSFLGLEGVVPCLLRTV